MALCRYFTIFRVFWPKLRLQKIIQSFDTMTNMATKETLHKNQAYKVFILISLIVLVSYLFVVTIVQPPRKQWNFCFYQLSADIEHNNSYLQSKSAGSEESCPIQEATIKRAEHCFKDVA